MSDLRAHQRAWSEVVNSALDLADDWRVAVRISDLVIAASIALDWNLLDSDASTAIDALAAYERPRELDRTAVDQLMPLARAASQHLCEGDCFWTWSQASQGADPGRKGRGAYNTPAPFARVLATQADISQGDRVCDPSAGHGLLLMAAFDQLIECGATSSAALDSLFGAELDRQAWELCTIFLWLHSRGARDLPDIRSRVIHANALTSTWRSDGADALHEAIAVTAHRLSFGIPELGDHVDVVAAESAHWDLRFDDVFADGGFDVVLANPPWDSLRHRSGDESDTDPHRAASRYWVTSALTNGRAPLPALYTAQGRGDANLFKAFVELLLHLVADGGRISALLPGAFASDLGTAQLRAAYLSSTTLDRWTGYENLERHFPIDGRYKFGLLRATRSDQGTKSSRMRFFARHPEDAQGDHIRVTAQRLRRIGGSHGMFLEATSDEELAVVERAMDTGVPFFEEGTFGLIRYQREMDLTLGRSAGNMVHIEDAEALGFTHDGQGSWRSPGSPEILRPLLEGRSVGAWTFAAKSYVEGAGRSARWVGNSPATDLGAFRPQYLTEARPGDGYRIAIADVTSATNARTVMASWLPDWTCGNTAPVLVTQGEDEMFALLAVLNSMTFDWIARRIVSGLHLNKFYLALMPLPVFAEEGLATLAAFARNQTLASSPAATLADIALTDSVSHAAVEALVAQGFGLDASDLALVMNDSTADRRGLWRYFRNVPESRLVADESVALLSALV